MKFLNSAGLLFAFAATFFLSAMPASPAPRDAAPARYRDFQVYATSKPDVDDPARIVVRVQFENRGTVVLRPQIALTGNPRLGLPALTVTVRVEPKVTTAWGFPLKPVDGITTEVIKGTIRFNNKPSRDLFIAVQGPDPADFTSTGVYRNVSKISARAEVVGAYAPVVTPTDWARKTTSPKRDKRALTLAKAGASAYSIVVPNLPRAADGKALELTEWRKQKDQAVGEDAFIDAIVDLQRALKVMSGATVPVTGEPTVTNKAPVIRMRLNSTRKWPHADAYRLQTVGKDVLIESGHYDGLRQGVYGLLTDHLDCHWFQPGQIGEEIPRPADCAVTLLPVNEEKQPSFYSSTGMSWGRYRNWDYRNRSIVNRGRMSFGHAWHALVPPTDENIKNHPNWFARDEQGKVRYFNKVWSWTNICTTEPEVIEMVAKKINGQLSNGDTLVASLDPNDLSLHCRCDRCMALDRSYGVVHEKNPFPMAGPYDVVENDGLRVTDRLIHFSNEIYKRLEPKNQEKYLGILAYAYQIEPPVSAKPHPRHVTMVCNIPWNYDHSRPFTDPTAPLNRDFGRILTAWGKIVPQLGFYDYYGHYEFFGPWGLIHKIREDLPAFRDLGGTFLMIEAQPNYAMHGLNLYIASRLAWDVDADVDALLEEYCRKYYGPAAEPMYHFWTTAERHYALTRPGSNTMERAGTNPMMWQEMETYLKAAETAVTGADERFRNRIAFNRDGFDLGRGQFEILSRYFLPARAGKKVDYAGAAQATADYRVWLKCIEKKHANGDGYYPSILASYLYGEIEKMLKEVETRASEAAQGINANQ